MMKVSLQKSAIALLVGILIGVFGIASYNPAAIPSVPSIASLQALGAASPYYANVYVTSYLAGRTTGGGSFTWNATSTATADGCTIFAATAVSTGRWIRDNQTSLTPLDCGAYGDGVRGNAGVANGTATFTDGSASFTSAQAADTVLIVPPIETANAAVATTVSTVGSGTSITLASGPSWSATGVIYYIGHNDNTAFTNWAAAVGAKQAAAGYSASYNTYSVTGCGNIPGSRIYVLTQAFVVGGALATTPQCVRGVDGTPTIAIGGLGDTTDAVTLGGSATTSGMVVQDLNFDTTFSGQDGVALAGFQSPLLKNISIRNAKRDCFSVKPGASSFIQQGDFEDFNGQYCGRHGLEWNVNGASFANEINFTNLVLGGVSARQAGGTGINLDSDGTGSDSVSFLNYKVTEAWDGNASYQPLPNPVNVAAGVYGVQVPWSFTGGYSEQSVAHPLGAASAFIGVQSGAQMHAFVYQNDVSNWGATCSQTPYDGCGFFTLTSGATHVMFAVTADNGYAGTCVFTNARVSGGANASQYIYSFNAQGQTATDNSTSVVNDSGNGAATASIALTFPGNVTTATVTNNAAFTTKFSYSCLSSFSTANPGYVTQ